MAVDIEVQVIIPVHNAASTIDEAVDSAMNQVVPQHLVSRLSSYSIISFVCCYDDGSTDDSLEVLRALEEKYAAKPAGSSGNDSDDAGIPSNLLIHSGEPARGAGYARNQAVNLRESQNALPAENSFLCLLDSDDMMHPHRIAEQLDFMMSLNISTRLKALVGCNFDRIPPDSTWHYASWANNLTDDRLLLEKFREVTILQPTWMLCKSRWTELGGEIEAPLAGSNQSVETAIVKYSEKCSLCMIHAEETLQSLRLAEDLRFFHNHLYSDGVLYLHRTKEPLVTYRHTGTSQSFSTSRKLLQSLRVKAFEESILKKDEFWQKNGGVFVVWGAGRDGKEFVKALEPQSRKRVYCFVDVDEKKIRGGFYANRDLDLRIPIVHYSMLASDPSTRKDLQLRWEEGLDDNETAGRINKGKPGSNQLHKNAQSTATPPRKKQKPNAIVSEVVDSDLLPQLPVVVCVAMYRTNGVLEDNVKSIGRKEGVNLWHFS